MVNKTLLTLAALIVLGTAFTAKADTLTFANTQVYYVGDASDGVINPFGLTNPGGNPISVLGMTSAGSAGTLVFDTGGTPGVSLVSNAPGLFDVQLYGDTSGIISGGKLVTGVYTFDSASDTFTVNGYTNSGVNPTDYVTINVAANGVVTVQSDSLELAVDPPPPPSDPPTTGVPEVDPTTSMSAFTLIAGAVFMIRGRRKNFNVG
jgi:hypothetical protein